MNREQKKARLKAMKQRMKEARRAAAAGGPVSAANPGPESPLPVGEVTAQLGQARELVAHVADLSDAEARLMLSDAARLVHHVVRTTDAALEHVPETWRIEAAQIVMARPEPTEIPAQQRPRRGTDPVVTLMKVGLQASSLLTRIIGKLHPGLGRMKRAA